MKILSYVELTPAQERVLNDLENVTVRTALIKPVVVATVRTFQAQAVKLVIDEAGVIQNVMLENA